MKKIKTGIFTLLAGLSAGILGTRWYMNKELDRVSKYSDKHLKLFLMMNQWVKVRQKGKKLECYFEEKGYKKIAVYGMSYVGVTLVEELKNTKIEVVYGIDKNADNIATIIDIITLKDEMKEVDAIVVTAIVFYEDIKRQLREKANCPVISLEDILYDM